MKTVIDLMREYVWVSDLCDAYNKEHNAGVKPWDCVRDCEGKSFLNDNILLEFIKDRHPLQFAVAILEGRPVFVGDEIYSKYGKKFVVCDGCIDSLTEKYTFDYGLFPWSELSWNPPTPKRTFTLNGVELPCPIPYKDGVMMPHLVIFGNVYHFENAAQIQEWNKAISGLLTEAREKP